MLLIHNGRKICDAKGTGRAQFAQALVYTAAIPLVAGISGPSIPLNGNTLLSMPFHNQPHVA